MGRGLPQGVIGKAKQEVSLDDSFRFEWKRCGHCCFRCEIVLTPYDILRLGADSPPGMLRRCVGEIKAPTPDPFPPLVQGGRLPAEAFSIFRFGDSRMLTMPRHQNGPLKGDCAPSEWPFET